MREGLIRRYCGQCGQVTTQTVDIDSLRRGLEHARNQCKSCGKASPSDDKSGILDSLLREVIEKEDQKP